MYPRTRKSPLWFRVAQVLTTRLLIPLFHLPTHVNKVWG